MPILPSPLPPVHSCALMSTLYCTSKRFNPQVRMQRLC